MENAEIATAENSTTQNDFVGEQDRKIAHNIRKNIKRLKRDNFTRIYKQNKILRRSKVGMYTKELDYCREVLNLIQIFVEA